VSEIWIPDSARNAKPDPWLAENHLQMVLDDVLAAGDDSFFVEYGSGGSTLWWHDRLPETVTHVAFETNREWADKVLKHGGPVIMATTESYARGSNIDTSCPDPNFICRPEVAAADVVFVDGWNRTACLAWVSHVAQNGTVVYLHDANFPEWQGILRLPCWKFQEIIPSDGTNNPSELARMVLER
jgi:hypothetical protein